MEIDKQESESEQQKRRRSKSIRMQLMRTLQSTEGSADPPVIAEHLKIVSSAKRVLLPHLIIPIFAPFMKWKSMKDSPSSSWNCSKGRRCAN